MTSEERTDEVIAFISARDRVSYPEIFAAHEGDLAAIFLETRRLYQNGKIERVGPGVFQVAEEDQETVDEEISEFEWQDDVVDEREG